MDKIDETFTIPNCDPLTFTHWMENTVRRLWGKQTWRPFNDGNIKGSISFPHCQSVAGLDDDVLLKISADYTSPNERGTVNFETLYDVIKLNVTRSQGNSIEVHVFSAYDNDAVWFYYDTSLRPAIGERYNIYDLKLHGGQPGAPPKRPTPAKDELRQYMVQEAELIALKGSGLSNTQISQQITRRGRKIGVEGVKTIFKKWRRLQRMAALEELAQRVQNPP
jgi:hypothetical protein